MSRCGINSSEVDSLSRTDMLKLVTVVTTRRPETSASVVRLLGRFLFLPPVRGRDKLERIMHLSKLSSVILKDDNKYLRHYASTESTKMTVYNADRMSVTEKGAFLIYISYKFFLLKVGHHPMGKHAVAVQMKMSPS